MVFSVVVLFTQEKVTGIVTSDNGWPIPGANVYLEDTNLGAAADWDGIFKIMNVPLGEYRLVARAVGFRTGSASISVFEGSPVTQDFALGIDAIRLDEIVTTAMRNPLSKIESSVAITTFSDMDIRRNEPQSTADLMSNIPGFYVESSGGQVGNNLFARGLPADGSYRYVALMEDGMPVYDETELYFVNADIFIRLDDNIDRVEAVRGGNSALFGHNNPGGVINFISKTGGPETEASLRITAGTDGFFRTDFNMNGPVFDAWRYNIGGFYRFDEGLRVTGIPVSKGGQVKANVTRLFDSGYVRLYAKYLKDSNTFYLGLPVIGESQEGGKKFVLTEEFVDKFPAKGSMATEEGNLLRVPTPEGFFTMPLEDGQKQVGSALMVEFNFDLDGGWKVHNVARWMDFQHGWNAIVPFSISETKDADNPTYAGTSTVVSEKYLSSSGLWHVAMPLTNFSNRFQLQRSLNLGGVSHGITLGYYFGRHTQGSFWFWQNIMTTVPDEDNELARLVDVTGSQNGFTQYGSLFLNANGRVSTRAFFAGDDIQISDALRLDIGIRSETNDFRNYSENEESYDLGDTTTTADDAVMWGDGSFRQAEAHFSNLALSLGVNFLLSDRVSVYGRASTGYKTPMASEIMWSSGDVTSGDSPLVAEDLLQVEAGVKVGTPILGVNATVYLLQLRNFPSSDARVVDGETIFIIDYVGEARTIGLEVEGVGNFGPIGLNSTFTFQKHEYVKFGEVDKDRAGKWVRRIPQIFVNASVTYDIARITLGGKFVFIGLRYANTANDIELPAFGVVNLSASYDLTNNITAKVHATNALNAIGLTEGNPRTDETGAYVTGPVLARPILPRRIQASLSFKF